jgi:Delta7-sterol 5-desaturase
MNILYNSVQALYTLPLEQAAFWATLGNVLMFVAALAGGEVLLRLHGDHRISPVPEAVSRTEILLAVVCVILNSLVAVVGIVIWRAGLIQLRPYGDYTIFTIVQDTIVLFFAMDFAMYLFHRVAHLPLLYPLLHQTHHRYENPRPLTLFVLNPFEVLGFGALWIVVVVLYHSSIEGILIYLAFNLIFGLVGHLGVEPMPEKWVNLPLLRYISTSTFHAEHHMDKDHNYGFYTLIWDRLFGTLSPEYLLDFTTATASSPRV